MEFSVLMLQKEDFDLSDTQCLPDAITEQYLRMSKYIAHDAELKYSKQFENDVAKNANGHESGFTVEESDAVKPLRVSIEVIESPIESCDDFACNILKKKDIKKHWSKFLAIYATSASNFKHAKKFFSLPVNPQMHFSGS